MLYDLNIAWSLSTTKDQLLQLLSLSSSLGYATVALNHNLIQPPAPSQPAPFPHLSSDPSSTKLPHILHRATIHFSDPSSFTYRLQNLAKVYHIIAVRPLTDKAFQNACLTLDVPIISLDMSQQLPFYFKPKTCMAAVSRGIRFEICYSQALAADARGRAQCISNATGLIRATRGRGIFISSEAKTALGLRAPADVVNLLSVWGLGNEKGMEGIGTIPRSVVVNEGIKRNGFRGVIDIVQVAERDPSEVSQNEKGQPHQGSKKQKSQKRKGGEGDTQQPGKRNAKKMKLVVQESGAPRT